MACPEDFVLLRFEDFLDDPVKETRRLARALELHGVSDAEERVKEAVKVGGRCRRRDPRLEARNA